MLALCQNEEDSEAKEPCKRLETPRNPMEETQDSFQNAVRTVLIARYAGLRHGIAPIKMFQEKPDVKITKLRELLQ